LVHLPAEYENDPRAKLQRSRVYLRITLDVSDLEPNAAISPLHAVVPEVSRSRSSNPMSFHPMSARW
jgi:hypothetical protein